ncbi:energy transducer TonB [Marinoscillum sp.]|uniref:energy transducer TonB n=1 Tax=Marinoscillum sp. TaxID=2024838 RepID=UPI003BA9F218
MSNDRKIIWNPEEPVFLSDSSRDFDRLVRRAQQRKFTVKVWRQATTASIMGIGVLTVIFFNQPATEPPIPNNHTTPFSSETGPFVAPMSIVEIPDNAPRASHPEVVMPVANDKPEGEPVQEKENAAFTPTEYTQAYPAVGIDSLYAFFNAGIHEILKIGKYPVTSAKTTVNFMIDQTGRPVKISVKALEQPALEHKIIELVTRMPHWKPATANGEPVATWFAIPLGLEYQTVLDSAEGASTIRPEN